MGLARNDVTYEAFFSAHVAGSVRLAHLLTGSVTVAEDLVQDAFAAVFPRFHDLEEPAGYLRVAVVNACRSWHRRQRRELSRRHLLADLTGESPVHSDLLDAVDRLPYRYKAVLILRYWAGLSEREIATALECQPGRVKTWSARALRQLRKDVPR